jgi:glycosyltransferase involved in cell wall biosynthesis
MRVTMINDCAYVGETLLKYLPRNVEKAHIKRSRGLWSKTFGIAYKILKAKADVYHAHYLLQDCYLASLFRKKPLIGHAHGSDLTAALHRFPFRRIVRSNLKKCDKILVSTPGLIEIAKQYRRDVEYLPNPVDMELFYPKPLRLHEGKLKVLIAGGSNWSVKGTDKTIRALARLKDKVEVSIIEYGKDFEKTLVLAKTVGLSISILPRVPHQNLHDYFWDSDVVMDQFQVGTFGQTSLEAIACGRPTVTYVSSRYEAYKGFPLQDIHTIEDIAETIENLSPLLWKKEYAYLQQNHTPERIVNALMKLYESF